MAPRDSFSDTTRQRIKNAYRELRASEGPVSRALVRAKGVIDRLSGREARREERQRALEEARGRAARWGGDDPAT